MQFEWEPEKARANEVKHGVTFAEATEIFADSLSSTVADPDHSEFEERFVIFGMSSTNRCLVASFTERGDRIRIISARTMTRQEQAAYEQ
jgi:uncharacterized DUF497 family protein